MSCCLSHEDPARFRVCQWGRAGVEGRVRREGRGRGQGKEGGRGRGQGKEGGQGYRAG